MFAFLQMVCRIIGITALCLFVVISGVAARYTVRIEEPQPAQRVEGVVLDPSGAPIPDVTVSDRTDQWEAVLRTAKTDRQGRFHFSREHKKVVYYLHFEHPMFNPLELKLKLNKKALQRGSLRDLKLAVKDRW
jgi:hypothetical protein